LGTAACAPQAQCRDLEDGYTCECKDGYVDRSPDLSLPGRVCAPPNACASNHECSAAALCEPGTQPGQYKCTCIQGYVDQSPAGQQGRICVRGRFWADLVVVTLMVYAFGARLIDALCILLMNAYLLAEFILHQQQTIVRGRWRRAYAMLRLCALTIYTHNSRATASTATRTCAATVRSVCA
jgi:hypothetical protein